MSRFALVLFLVIGCTFSKELPPDPGAGGKADDTSVAPPSLRAIEHFLYTPLVKQNAEHTCGVAALRSVLHYYGVPDEHEAVLADKLGSHPDWGTNYRAIVDYAKSVGLTATTHTEMSIDDLARNIDRGTPVILALQAWADDPQIDWRESYDNGHYVVATGYDAANIYFMDPYMRGSYTYIPRAQLEDRWHDMDGEGPLEHFGIVIAGRAPAFDFDRVLPMP